MADIISGRDVGDEEIVSLIELLFFAYRDFTSDPDAILAEWGFGRAHHRVVHFVGRNPGMTVADLNGADFVDPERGPDGQVARTAFLGGPRQDW